MIKPALFIITLFTLILAACSPAAAPAEPPFADDGSRAAVEEAAGGAMPEAPAAEPAFDSSVEEFQSGEGAAVERLVIKNASLDIVVADAPETMDAVGRMAEEMGGFIVTANLYQTRLASGVEVPRATITIRVPAERLDEALERIEARSDQPVENKTINSQDVTQEYTDLQSRLRNLEATEAQLMRIMEDAIRTEDVLRVYNELTQVREQIEVTKGRIQYFEQSARLSSITVNILPEEAVQPLSVGGWQPVGVARDAIQALLNGLQYLATAAIWLGLFLIPLLVVIVLPLYLIVRALLRWRARRKERQAAQPAG